MRKECYRGADKSLARPTFRCVSVDGENISFDASLVIYYYYYYYYYCYRYSAFGPVWTETRAQSGDWYGSGTLHPGQVLRGSLLLLSPGIYIYVCVCVLCLNISVIWLPNFLTLG